MKHIRGNTPKCWSCKYYTEEIAEKLTTGNDGWCINKDYLRTGINGRKIKNPQPHTQKRKYDHACEYWIDAESGYTRFEVLTGYKEPYDGTRIDFDEEQQIMFKDGD